MRYVGAVTPVTGEDRKKYVVGSGGVSTNQTVFGVNYTEGRVEVYLNGVRLFPDTDFTRTASGVGANITLASGVGASDVLEVVGYQGIHGGNAFIEDRFIVGTSSSGSGGSYTNSTTVFPVASNTGDSVSVFRNGVKLVHTTDFTVAPASSTVTLDSAASSADEICIQVVGVMVNTNFIKSADLIDEDSFSTNSATKVPSQQSVKAYIDTQLTAEDLDLTTDSGTIAIDLDSETLTVAGGTGINTSASSNTATVAIDSTVATLTGSQTLTNKTITMAGDMTMPTNKKVIQKGAFMQSPLHQSLVLGY